MDPAAKPAAGVVMEPTHRGGELDPDVLAAIIRRGACKAVRAADGAQVRLVVAHEMSPRVAVPPVADPLQQLWIGGSAVPHHRRHRCRLWSHGPVSPLGHPNTGCIVRVHAPSYFIMTAQSGLRQRHHGRILTGRDGPGKVLSSTFITLCDGRVAPSRYRCATITQERTSISYTKLIHTTLESTRHSHDAHVSMAASWRRDPRVPA